MHSNASTLLMLPFLSSAHALQQGEKIVIDNLMNAFYSLGMSLECQPLPEQRIKAFLPNTLLTNEGENILVTRNFSLRVNAPTPWNHGTGLCVGYRAPSQSAVAVHDYRLCEERGVLFGVFTDLEDVFHDKLGLTCGNVTAHKVLSVQRGVVWETSTRTFCHYRISLTH